MLLLRSTLVLLLFGLSLADEEYDRLFDPNFDVDSVIDNDRLLNAYLHCFFNEGPCADRPQLAKGKIREILESTCSKCNDFHRERLKYMLDKFIAKRPHDWERILEVYDPEMQFRDNAEKLKQGLPP